MIRQLKARIKKHGMSTVVSGLGYRSATSVYRWIKENKIPDTAKEKVKNYLKENK